MQQSGKTVTGKYHSIYDLVDESVSHDQPFRVHIFVETSDIASHIQVGGILRIHRLQVDILHLQCLLLYILSFNLLFHGDST